VNLKKIKLSEIKEADYNPRIIEKEELEGLKASLRVFGQRENLIVNKDMTLISGHQRLKAMKDLGIEEAYCDIVDLNKKQEKKLNVIMNSQAISGKYEGVKLNDILIELKDEEDYLDLRLDELEIHIEEIEPDVEEDEAPAIPTQAITILGDLYELNGHRVHCADSTDVKAVEKLMDGEKADLGLNDPPYGVSYKSASGEKVLNDNLNFSNILEFNKDWVPLQFTVLKDNASFYCWGGDVPLMEIFSDILRPMIEAQKVSFRNLITWDKGCGQGQNDVSMRSYPFADEKCLFVMCGVQGFNNNSDNYYEGWESIRLALKKMADDVGLKAKDVKRICGVDMYSHWFTKSQWAFITEEHYTKLQKEYGSFQKEYGSFQKEYEELKKEYEELKKEFYATRAYFDNVHDNMNNVWHFERTNNSERLSAGGHATPKPLVLCARAIKSSCPKGGIVLDAFLGSGSTLMACEQTNRICYGQELDEKYCDIIIKRWINYMLKEDKEITLKRNGEIIDYNIFLNND